jgi:selenide,water dikinase
VEVALAVRGRLDRLGTSRAIISLLESTHIVLRDRSPAAQEEAEQALARAEITLRLSTGVAEAGPDHVRLSGGRVLSADLVIWTTGTEASPIFRASGLRVDARGYLLVDDDLAVRDAPGLFGAGDAVAHASFPRLPRAGIHAARQGPILAHNLAQALRGTGAARRYTPAPRALALLNTGDGRAILSYGGFATTTGWAMSLKDRIDRRFLGRFQRLSNGTGMAIVP